MKLDEWSVIEEGFHPQHNLVSESIFSIGNGRMGQRANFEEYYSGNTFEGTYVAGVYYPDKTRVGWWKNGYPEYFAKVLNATNWIGIHLTVAGNQLDLANCTIESFTRELNMREGYLERTFTVVLPNTDGWRLQVKATRFCSIVDDEAGAIRYAVTPLNFSAPVTINAFVDGDVINKDSNYDEKFWEELHKEADNGHALVSVKTKKLDFHVATGMRLSLTQNGQPVAFKAQLEERTKFVGNVIEHNLVQGEETVVYKYAAVLSSENHPKPALVSRCRNELDRIAGKGFDTLKMEQANAWALKWEESDIEIEGDVAAQQGIRFNIFQLNQTYTGEDERLNIGPKGFTGEKYGGSTYWDTEAYCLPFYLSTADQRVARNLLIYRYKHLDKAIENAEKLGFKNGAALYPMVTMNGEECHNEWEITFEEIHRNGAMAYAIYNYVRYTDEQQYLADYGLEVLIGISRFWAQRVNWSDNRQKYVMLGVTGPNEYDNNVNNNWYTNVLARWTMDYTREVVDFVKSNYAEQYAAIVAKRNFDEAGETEKWKHISDNIYLPYDEALGLSMQQDGFLDKEQLTVADIPEGEYPIHKHWSWDRILRSIYIKQPDLLLGMYFFEEQYDLETIRKHFDFYEPKTVHESSLSPSIHSIIASAIDYKEKAYELYLRTARLDIDDYNHDTCDGLHITASSGAWLAIVYGFGGMRVKDGKLHFKPYLPGNWQSYSFHLRFRGAIILVKVNKEGVKIVNHSDKPVELVLFDTERTIAPEDAEVVAY